MRCGDGLGLGLARLGEVEPGRPPGQHLARRGGLAVADEHTSVLGGALVAWVVRRAMVECANLPSGRGFARISHRRDHCLPGLPAAGGVAGAGGGGQASRPMPPRSTGAGPCPASATRLPRCRGRPRARRRTVGTGPGVCSRATDRATGCSAPCTAPAWPTSRRAPTEATASRSPGAYIAAAVRCAPAGQQADHRGARPLPALPASASWRCSPTCGSWCVSACSPTTSWLPQLGVRPKPRFGHGVEASSPSGRTAAVLLPPQPARDPASGGSRDCICQTHPARS